MAHLSFTSHRRRAVQGLVVALVAIVPFVVAVPSAFAAVSVGIAPKFPSVVSIGQTGVSASLQISNSSTAPDNNVTVNSIVLVPACGTTILSGNGDCPSGSADPGVFTVASTGAGQAGTACAGDTFAISVIDASTGEVQLSPSSTVVLTPSGAGAVCDINLSFAANQAPAHPSSMPNANVYQVEVAATATATSPATGSTTTTYGDTTINIDKANPGLTTTATSPATVGGSISDSASISAASPPGPSPGGTITFRLYGPSNLTCAAPATFTSSPVAVAGTGTYSSGSFTPTASGTYFWVATYSGDANNAGVAGPCGAVGETSTVSSATPTIATTASASVALGGSISDTATLSGGFSPTGTITFSVYGPNNQSCTGSAAFTSVVTVSSGDGNYRSASFTPTAAGTYQFVAAYSGDANNGAVSGICGAPNESVVVTPPARGTYTPVAPGRDLDTRNNTGGTTGPVHGNTTFNLTVDGVNGVPATGVGAVALNVTVTSPTCASYLTVFPTGQPVPATSNLNYTAGETVPNLVIVGVGTGGQVAFNVPASCAGTVQVIADIQGWYGPAA